MDVTYGYCRLDVDIREEDGRRHAPKGRIVIHQYSNDAFVHLAKGGRIRAVVPSVSYGSQASREKNIRVQYVSLITAKGLKLDWTDVPDIVGSSFTVQDDANITLIVPADTYAGRSWGSSRIWKVTDLRPKAVA